MKLSNETLIKIEAAKKNGYKILGSGIGFGQNWAVRDTAFEKMLEKTGYSDFFRIAKTNCRKSGYTKRLIYAAKKEGEK